MKIYNITISPETAKSLLTGFIPIGAGIGALIGRKLIHVFSRRKFILFINLVAIIAGSIVFVNNWILFLCMRLIQGMCVGMNTSIAPLYIT
jgi:MFS family permease